MSLAGERERALELAERLHGIGPIAVTRFFSGAGLARDGVQFAFVIGGVIYFRVDDLARPDFAALGATPFAYASGSKTVTVASYYELPDEIADDPDRLRCWAIRAMHAAVAAKATGRGRGRRVRSP